MTRYDWRQRNRMYDFSEKFSAFFISDCGFISHSKTYSLPSHRNIEHPTSNSEHRSPFARAGTIPPGEGAFCEHKRLYPASCGFRRVFNGLTSVKGRSWELEVRSEKIVTKSPEPQPSTTSNCQRTNPPRRGGGGGVLMALRLRTTSSSADNSTRGFHAQVAGTKLTFLTTDEHRRTRILNHRGTETQKEEFMI